MEEKKPKMPKSRILHLRKPKKSAKEVEEDMKKDSEGALLLEMTTKIREELEREDSGTKANSGEE